jgi:hypothetical protein
LRDFSLKENAMYRNGTIVEVFEDPLTMKRKEGNAMIVRHELEIERGLDQYWVNFVGDDPKAIYLRTISYVPLFVSDVANVQKLAEKRLEAFHVS